MKTKEKYKPNTNQNSEKITLEKTIPKSDDPLIQAYIDAKKQKIYTTEETGPIKKRDLRYFGRLGAKLAEESAKKIEKELEEEYKNKQT